MKLKQLRKANSLTQKDLAEKSGVSIRTLQNYECNHRSLNKATLSHLVDFANALNVKFYELIEDKELKEKIKKNLEE